MNIIMIPFHDYKKWLHEGFRTRDAHLCQHFETSDDVEKILVVNRPTSMAERLIKRSSWKTPCETVIYNENGIQLSKMSEKVWCIDFSLKDFYKVLKQRKTWWFTAFTYKKVIDAINKAIDVLNMDNSILLLQNPMAIGVAEGVKSKSFVFDAIDNWLHHPQMKDKSLIKKNYEYVDKQADLILTVSEALTEMFTQNKNVNWVPNGVDIDYFSNSIKNHFDDNKTVVGYVGKIQERVDFDLVERCLNLLPNFSFEFIGPIYAQQERIKKLKESYPNIHFRGDVHYSKLPEEMKSFDITVIPHKIDDFTASMNPLKLYEYLAAGKIVVTTGVAGTQNISPYVYVAKDDTEFVNQLRNVAFFLKEGKIETKDIIESIPQDCNWSSRVQAMINLFKEL